MLAIRKRHITIKAVTAGTAAFLIGLTSVAAYMESMLQSRNVTFNKVQDVRKPDTSAKDQKQTEQKAQTEASTPTTVPTHSAQLYTSPSRSPQQSTSPPAAVTAQPNATPAIPSQNVTPVPTVTQPSLPPVTDGETDDPLPDPLVTDPDTLINDIINKLP